MIQPKGKRASWSPDRPWYAVLGMVLAIGCVRCSGGDEGGPLRVQSPGVQLEEVDHYVFGISEIMFMVPQGAPDARARKEAWKAFHDLRNGADFKAMARTRGEASNRFGDGFQGFPPVHHDTAWHGAAQCLMPGMISPPIRTKTAWHVIYRHRFHEAVELERRFRVPVYGFHIPYKRDAAPGVEPTNSTLTKEEAFKRAREAIQMLSRGKLTLSDARKKFSPSSRSHPNEYLGFVSPAEADDPFFRALHALEPGQFAEPHDSPRGIAVLVRGSHVRAFARHILVQDARTNMRIQRRPQDAEKLAMEILAKLKADPEYWDKAVIDHSDDPMTSSNRGTLGVVTHGQGLDPLADALRNTKPGAIHPQIVRSPQGLHIVMRVE